MIDLENSLNRGYLNRLIGDDGITLISKMPVENLTEEEVHDYLILAVIMAEKVPYLTDTEIRAFLDCWVRHLYQKRFMTDEEICNLLNPMKNIEKRSEENVKLIKNQLKSISDADGRYIKTLIKNLDSAEKDKKKSSEAATNANKTADDELPKIMPLRDQFKEAAAAFSEASGIEVPESAWPASAEPVSIKSNDVIFGFPEDAVTMQGFRDFLKYYADLRKTERKGAASPLIAETAKNDKNGFGLIYAVLYDLLSRRIENHEKVTKEAVSERIVPQIETVAGLLIEKGYSGTAFLDSVFSLLYGLYQNPDEYDKNNIDSADCIAALILKMADASNPDCSANVVLEDVLKISREKGSGDGAIGAGKETAAKRSGRKSSSKKAAKTEELNTDVSDASVSENPDTLANRVWGILFNNTSDSGIDIKIEQTEDGRNLFIGKLNFAVVEEVPEPKKSEAESAPSTAAASSEADWISGIQEEFSKCSEFKDFRKAYDTLKRAEKKRSDYLAKAADFERNANDASFRVKALKTLSEDSKTETGLLKRLQDNLIASLPEYEKATIEAKDEYEISLNVVRKILFVLGENKFMICKRERDTTSGWLTFRWRLNMIGIDHQLEREMKKLYRNLAKRQEFEETNLFYVCPQHCVRLVFNEATEWEFECPVCGDDLVFEDNEVFKELINKRVDEFKNSS